MLIDIAWCSPAYTAFYCYFDGAIRVKKKYQMVENPQIERDFYGEFTFITSRSGGAGGQNVNKVSTKVELRFHVDTSLLLTDEEKQLLNKKSESKITNEGFLQIVSQEERSQLKNKQLCVKKFYELLKKSLTKPKKRKPTKGFWTRWKPLRKK